jgi:hypothetical protein
MARKRRVRSSPRPSYCWICRRSFEATGKGGRRICGAERCVEARARIYRVLRARRDQAHAEDCCRYCSEPPAAGSKFCAVHQFLRDPCPRCGTGRRRRNEKQGCHPVYCDACRGRGLEPVTAKAGS